MYRSDRTQFGGVLLLVNNNLRHDSFSLPPLPGLEATAVYLQLQNHGQLLFISAYLPPTANITPTDLDAIFSLHDTVVLAGDLNCKHVSWNNASVNRNGNTLLSYCLNNSIAINYPNHPTHFPHHSPPSVLDIALSQRCSTSKPLSIPTLSSDHNPIVFKVHLHPVLSAPRRVYNYKHANWPLFRSSLDSTLDPLPSSPNTHALDLAISSFTHSVLQAATQAIPAHTVKCNRLTLPPHLLYLWKLKNHYRHRYQRNRSPLLYSLSSLFTHVFSTSFTRFRNSKWSSFLDSLQPQASSFWKIARYFTKPSASFHPLVYQGVQVYHDQRKADLLAQQFESSHHLTLHLGTPHHSTAITRYVDKFFRTTTPHAAPLNLTNVYEVERKILS